MFAPRIYDVVGKLVVPLNGEAGQEQVTIEKAEPIDIDCWAIWILGPEVGVIIVPLQLRFINQVGPEDMSPIANDVTVETVEIGRPRVTEQSACVGIGFIVIVVGIANEELVVI